MQQQMDIDQNFEDLESIGLTHPKKYLLICFTCKSYNHGPIENSSEHVCGFNWNGNRDLLRCMRILVDTIFYADLLQLDDSSVNPNNLPYSPTLRSANLVHSSIHFSSMHGNIGMNRLVTSTPKEFER